LQDTGREVDELVQDHTSLETGAYIQKWENLKENVQKRRKMQL
jgi:hypothetical protein